MKNSVFARFRQGYKTIAYPRGKLPALPDRLRGVPRVDWSGCPSTCKACEERCPTKAIDAGKKSVDLGLCLFCTDCTEACPQKAIAFSGDYRLATRKREDLVLDEARREVRLAEALDKKMKRLFGRSLKLRVVSAGGCNACEADVNVLGTIGWDLGRFGISYVASPRHADGILITGPVTKNMEEALRKTWDAVPNPKLVIAVGTCAVSGGLYAGSGETLGGADPVVPVDLYIPGCPPHPLTILDGLLRLLGRLPKNRL